MLHENCSDYTERGSGRERLSANTGTASLLVRTTAEREVRFHTVPSRQNGVQCAQSVRRVVLISRSADHINDRLATDWERV